MRAPRTVACLAAVAVVGTALAAAAAPGSPSAIGMPFSQPGPPILYRAPAHAPQLQNAGIWHAKPILISGTHAYRDGEYLYQDYLYDDHGARFTKDPNDPRSNNDFSAPNGTYTYPTGIANANAADFVEVRVKPPPGLPRPSDGISGGTGQSMAEVTGDPDAAVAADSAALVGDPARALAVRETSPIEVGIRRGPGGSVIAPMAPAAFINPAVIQRTAELTAPGEPAPPFRYREGVALDGGAATLPVRLAAAGALAATQLGMRRALLAGPAARRRVSSALSRILPSSGFGPDPDRLEDWHWSMRVEAATRREHRIEVEVEAVGHPGYLTTAKMLGEAGLILAGSAPGSFGCVTPAAALGTGSIAQLEHAGLRISAAG